jgi:DNA-binding transcriptional MerR regulator
MAEAATKLDVTVDELPPIPEKRYFAIGEVSDLCAVKPHVLRYWEQEFPQLRPTKRRGNRRYYQREDVQTIRQIRRLLYEEGFTITGARQRLREITRASQPSVEVPAPAGDTRAQLRAIRKELEGLLRLLER